MIRIQPGEALTEILETPASPPQVRIFFLFFRVSESETIFQFWPSLRAAEEHKKHFHPCILEGIGAHQDVGAQGRPGRPDSWGSEE